MGPDLRWANARIAAGMLVLVAVLIGTIAVFVPARAVPIVPFEARFATDDNGTIEIFGNNLLSCPTTDGRCAGARAGTQALNNNGFAMVSLDVDADPATYNSSNAQVVAPAGGEVLWAGLYWGARYSRGTGGVAATTPRTQMLLRVAGAAGYTPIASQDSFGPTAGDQAYQEFADVTSLVQAAGPGTYWGANVATGTGEDRYAGWSLVVVYRSPDLPLRNLTVFDGFSDVGQNQPQEVVISGFRTPVTGAVETELGMIAYEGDFATSGDNARLNDTQLSTTPLSKGSNFFNGTNDDNGTSVPTRSPAHLNMLGYDVKNLATTGIANGATSASISLASTGDRYFPGVVTTAIKLFAPDFTTSTKTVTNLAGRDPALPGDTLEYTLTYPNTGQDPAVGVTLTDTLPAGTTFVSATPTSGSCTGSGRDVSCAIGTIGVDATWSAKVRAEVAPDAAGTTLTNAAVLDYTAQTLGRDLAYVVAPASIDVAAIADLSIIKEMSPDPAVAGGTVTATLIVANAGPSPAESATITDQLPEGATFVTATTPQGTCGAADGVLTCDLGTVVSGASVTVTVTLSVPASSTAGSLVNTASVSSSTADLVLDNNASGASVAVERSADLSITKTASSPTVVPGESVTFTVTARNDGLSDAVDAVVTDTVVDDALDFTGASAPGFPPCSVTDDVAQCTAPTLAPGAVMVMTVTARLSPDTSAGLVIADTATVRSATPDPDPDDNAADADVTTADPQSDLGVVKTAGEAVAGGQVQYSVEVSNLGPSSASGVTLSDPLPAGLTAVSATSSRGQCSVAATIACDIGTLPGPDADGQASSATITITADVAPDAVGPLENAATVDSDTIDPVPENNASTISTPVVAQADVSVTKTATPVQPAAGESVTFTVTVSNAGPATARTVTLNDALPPGLTLLGVDTPAGVTCTGAPAVTCEIGELAPQGSVEISVRMNVPASFDLNTGAVNTATVSTETDDPVSGNDTASATITTRAVSDVFVLKRDTSPIFFPVPPPGTFQAGATAQYYLAAGNFGPSDATSARITDTLPDGVVFVSSVPQCSFVPPNQVVCDIPVGAGLAGIFPITVRLSPDLEPGAQLQNSARVELANPDEVDPVSSNNFASLTNPVEASADLSVSKQTFSLDLPGPGPEPGFTVPSSAPAGTQGGYFLEVRNDGPSTARNVVLVDSSTLTDFLVQQIFLLRPGEAPVDITAQCSSSGGDLQCPLGDIAPFAAGTPSWGIQVNGLSLSSAQPGSYVNTATLSSSTPDADLDDNVAEAPITVTDPVATLGITKVYTGEDLNGDGVAQIVPGTAFSYQIVVTNAPDPNREGASDAPDVVVTDALPAGFTATSATATQGTCELSATTVTCELGTVLGPGRLPQPLPVEITISGTVASTVGEVFDVTNTATVESPISETATASLTTPVRALFDVSVVKVPDATEIAAGSTAGFSLVVTNAGPSDAILTEVIDLLPPEITFAPEQSDPRCALAAEGEVTYVSCPLGTLAAGETRTVRVAGTVAASQGTVDVVNTAFAASQLVAGEADLTNNRSDVPLSIVQSADLVVSKTADATAQAVGENVTYSVSVTNAGPSDATDVRIEDPIPAGFAFVEASGSAGLTCVLEGGTVVCTTPTLAAGETATAAIVVSLPIGLLPGTVANTATASSTTPDPDASSNSATATVDVFILADILVDKTVATAAPTIGQPLVFAIDVTNKGPQSAPTVVVSDSLAPGLTLISAVSEGAGTCQVTRPEEIDIVTCDVGALEVGATTRVLVTVSPAADLTTVTNGALVGSAALDELADDNYDELEVTLAPPVGEPPPPPSPSPAPAPAPAGSGLPATGGQLPIGILLGAIAAAGAGAVLLGIRSLLRARVPRN